MIKPKFKPEAQNPAPVLQAALLSQVVESRKAMGMTQAEIAQNVGLNRMTVQRTEAEGADPQLSNFLAMALAVNLTPKLVPNERAIHAQDLVHRGFSHVRTKHDLDWRDRQREAALAKAWELVNQHQTTGFSAILPTLVPGCTQDQASACATVVQWLGSEVGFDFLQNTLAQAGYTINEVKQAPKRKAQFGACR